MKFLIHALILFVFVTQGTQIVQPITPAVPDLDPQFKVHMHAQQFFDIHSGFLANLLEHAAQKAEGGDFANAQALAQQASALWDRFHRFTASLADHAPMDDMDSLFAELQTYSLLEELPHFAAICRNLSRLARSMGENHGLLWWNIF